MAAAAALATLDQIEGLDVPGNAGHVGAVMRERLRKLEHTCSFVGNVHGVGLMLGIEMVQDKALRTPIPRSSDIPARVAREDYQRGIFRGLQASVRRTAVPDAASCVAPSAFSCCLRQAMRHT